MRRTKRSNAGMSGANNAARAPSGSGKGGAISCVCSSEATLYCEMAAKRRLSASAPSHNRKGVWVLAKTSQSSAGGKRRSKPLSVAVFSRRVRKDAESMRTSVSKRKVKRKTLADNGKRRNGRRSLATRLAGQVAPAMLVCLVRKPFLNAPGTLQTRRNAPPFRNGDSPLGEMTLLRRKRGSHRREVTQPIRKHQLTCMPTGDPARDRRLAEM